MAQIEYSRSQLAPRIPDLMTGRLSFTCSDCCGAAFVLVLLIAVIFFSAASLTSYIKAKARLKFYHCLLFCVSRDRAGQDFILIFVGAGPAARWRSN
jgi:hypothetical protein